MATESAVTTLGAHPFSTGSDQCLVHNGSLSNHNNLRRELVREGIAFETQNDSEVAAAAYLTAPRWQRAKNLGEALTGALDDLDGFFTFVVGTKSGFGVVRDPIACKPAVMAETNQYVAFGSEYRALVSLPGHRDSSGLGTGTGNSLFLGPQKCCLISLTPADRERSDPCPFSICHRHPCANSILALHGSLFLTAQTTPISKLSTRAAITQLRWVSTARSTSRSADRWVTTAPA
jgi:asparagine synthetase B (glutamine-hydrolysing)